MQVVAKKKKTGSEIFEYFLIDIHSTGHDVFHLFNLQK